MQNTLKSLQGYYNVYVSFANEWVIIDSVPNTGSVSWHVNKDICLSSDGVNQPETFVEVIITADNEAGVEDVQEITIRS